MFVPLRDTQGHPAALHCTFDERILLFSASTLLERSRRDQGTLTREIRKTPAKEFIDS
jgi:hypothetical protein